MPDAIRDRFIEQAERGERVTLADVRDSKPLWGLVAEPTAPSHADDGADACLVPVGELEGETEADVETIRAIMCRNPDAARRVENMVVQKAATDVAFVARINAVYDEFHPVPTPPERSLSLLDTLGVGSCISHDVERRIQSQPDQRRNEIDALDHAKALITGFQDAIRAAIDPEGAYHEKASLPAPPERPRTLHDVLTIGGSIALCVQQQAPDIDRLVRVLHALANAGDPDTAELAQGEIDALRRANALIERYQDELRTSTGDDASRNTSPTRI